MVLCLSQKLVMGPGAIIRGNTVRDRSSTKSAHRTK